MFLQALPKRESWPLVDLLEASLVRATALEHRRLADLSLTQFVGVDAAPSRTLDSFGKAADTGLFLANSTGLPS